MNTSRGKGKLIDKKFFLNVLLISGMIVAFFLFCGFAGITNLLAEEHFASGVLVGGINVSGMTNAEVEAAVAEKMEQQLAQKQITLSYMGSEQVLDAAALGLSYDITGVVTQAYQYNKEATDTTEQRFDKTAYLSRGIDFEPELRLDEAQLRKSLEQYAAQHIQNPKNATASFDADSETFSYTSEQSGEKINTDQLLSDVTAAIHSGENAIVQVTGDVIPADITVGDLKKNTVLVSTFQTEAANNANRNTNISLISATVNGTEVRSGETLSINGLVGQRTEAKGYMPASAISDGILVDEVGGGICQLAGTLYNAALLADLDVVERVRHTWPSAYLPIGQDSTLTWDNKDLKIYNPTDYSLFISAKFEDQIVTVKIYGQPLEDGVTINVQNKIIKEIEPGKTEIRYTNDLPVGKTQTVRKARTGYKVEVYRIYYKNGVETGREKVSTDTYPALNKIVLKGRSSSQDK
jgi:vancomycin resistance protein YoaR